MEKKVHPYRRVITTMFKKRWVFKLLNAQAGDRVLDIGCGAGFMASEMRRRGIATIGVDISAPAVKKATTYISDPFICADVARLPFPDQTFDGATSTDSLEHIVDDVAAVKEVYRVLKPGCPFVIYVPSLGGVLKHLALTEAFHDHEHSYLQDVREGYSLKTLEKLFYDAGFVSVRVSYHLVFIQELITQLSKWLLATAGVHYSDQSEIDNVTRSWLFRIASLTSLFIVRALVGLEDFICNTLLRGRVPGHRVMGVGFKPQFESDKLDISLRDNLVCVGCRSKLLYDEVSNHLFCQPCSQVYAIERGVPIFFKDPHDDLAPTQGRLLDH